MSFGFRFTTRIKHTLRTFTDEPDLNLESSKGSSNFYGSSIGCAKLELTAVAAINMPSNSKGWLFMSHSKSPKDEVRVCAHLMSFGNIAVGTLLVARRQNPLPGS